MPPPPFATFPGRDECLRHEESSAPARPIHFPSQSLLYYTYCRNQNYQKLTQTILWRGARKCGKKFWDLKSPS